MLFDSYNMYTNFGEYEKAEEVFQEAMAKLPRIPVSKLDECDVRPLVEACGANVVVHCACGHKEIEEELPSIYKFLFVSKRTGAGGEMYFTVHVAVEYKCDSCMMQEFRKEVSPAFNRMSWAHGLSAYSRTHTVPEALKRLRATLGNPRWEICVSEKGGEIGPFGLYLQGQIVGLFDGDVWSSLDENGKRTSHDVSEWNFVGDNLEKFIEAKNDAWHRYFEGFLTQYHCVGIWVKKSCPRDLRDALKKEARRLGVPFWRV